MAKYVILILGFCCITAGATVINVPGDQGTIQDGINAAGEGDTVLVAPDTYTGTGNRRVFFGASNVTLLASGGPSVTTIDCAGSDASYQFAFYIGPDHDTTTRIEGFTITGAWHNVWDTAAVTIWQSSAVIRNCRIVGNENGAVKAVGTYPEVVTVKLDSCEFSGTTGDNAVWSGNCDLHVSNCRFVGNENSGLSAGMNNAVYVSDCEFSDNGNYGLIIEQNGGPQQITGCTFYNNQTGFQWDWLPPKKGDEPPDMATLDETMFMSGCVSAFNRHSGFLLYTPYDITVSCNDAFANWVYDYYGGAWGSGDEFGNLAVNPFFCDTAAGDLTLQDNSVCLPANNGCGVLMGAYGEGCEGPPPAVVRHVPSEYGTIQAAVDDCGEGDTVMVAPGTYVGDGNRRIDPYSLNLVIMSSAGPATTIIDCEGSEADPQFAFDVHGGQDTSFVIEGFTITGGYCNDWDSAAVTVQGSSLTIRDCDMTGNDGLALYIYGSYPIGRTLRIENCRVNENGGDVAVFCDYAKVRIFDSEFGHNAHTGFQAWQMSEFEVEGSVFHHNPGSGLAFSQWGPNCRLANNTFAYNGTGLAMDWDYPKSTSLETAATFDSSGMTGCIAAFNVSYGVYIASPFDYYMTCNDVYSNGIEDWLGTDEFYAGDPFNNFGLDPLFCDAAGDDLSVGDGSPCAPANSLCGTLIGAIDVGCNIGHEPTVYHVPSEFGTIQAALNVCFDGDTVLVAPDTYSGEGNRDLDFLGKSVVLISEEGPATTIIDCEGTSTDLHFGAWFHQGEDTTTVLDGFTIKRAWCESGDRGAITIVNSGATVRNCRIELTYGNGIRCTNAAMNLYNCVVDTSHLNGVHMIDTDARIDRLTATRNGHAIMWDATGQHLEVSNSLMADNHGYGASLFYVSGSWSFTNCTFARGMAGLVFNNREAGAAEADSSLIMNCIAAFNDQTGFASDGIEGPHLALCSDAYGNTGGDWDIEFGSWTPYGPGDANGNFTANPIFCDTATANYRLDNSSPCASANNTCSVVIGSEEVGCDCCEMRGDINHSGAGPDISDLVYLVSYMFVQGPVPFCHAEADFDGDGDVDISDLVSLVEYMFHDGAAPVQCQ